MESNNKRKQVSIVVPAHNEEAGIGISLKELSALMESTPYDFEIIVVDDGSTDRTAEIVMGFVKVQLIQQYYNKGYGASLKTGIDQSRYDIIAIIDADGTYPVKRLPELIDLIGPYDMAVGARTGNNVNIPFLRRLPRLILNKYANYLVQEKIPDLNSGLRVFKKGVFKKFRSLLPSGFSFTSTITMAMLSNNYRVKYLPIDYSKREGKSKIKPIRDTINFFKLVSKITLYFNPLRIFMPLTFIFLILGIFLLGYDFLNDNVTDRTILVFFFGMQFGLIGILADIIIHHR